MIPKSPVSDRIIVFVMKCLVLVWENNSFTRLVLCKNNVNTQHCPVTMVCLRCPDLDDAGVGWQTNDDDYTASTTDESVKNRSEMLFTRDAPQELTNQRPGSCHVTELWTNESWAGLIWLRPVTSVRSQSSVSEARRVSVRVKNQQEHDDTTSAHQFSWLTFNICNVKTDLMNVIKNFSFSMNFCH